MFRSWSCSQSIRQRICRRAVTLYFNLRFKITKIVQLDLFSPQRRTPLVQRSGLSSSEEWIHTSQCDIQSEPPIPSCFFSRLAKSPSTKTGLLSTCSCLRNLNATLGFPTRYLAASFSGITKFTHFLGQICFAVKNSLICFGPNLKVSHTQISVSCCIFSLQNRTLSIV